MVYIYLMPAKVLITKEGQEDFDDLPVVAQERVLDVFDRLSQWPDVSGAKPLSREWVGHLRIRTGDYRVIFRLVGSDVLVVRIKHRRDVYEE